ncbi:MAG TPA: hypothetical protein VNI58_01340 [Mariprofundaceae bacterium]|nr:hypothetical protein [Mariprofundaceae bacterium]
MKKVLILASLFLSFAGIARADETISIKVGYQMLKPSGTFAGNIAGVGTHADVKNDLGLKNSNQPTGEVALQFGDSRLSLGFIPMDFKGTGTLARTITFNGQNFTAGTTVNSQLKGDIYDIAYTYYLINMDDLPSRFQLGIEGAVKVVKAKASMTSAAQTQSVSATVGIPTIGLRARVALADFIGLVGRVGYLGYSGNHFLDADAQVEFSPLPMVGIYGGYRYLQVKVDQSGLFVDTKFQGPYIGGLVRF